MTVTTRPMRPEAFVTRIPWSRITPSLLVALLAGCSWSRFDDVTEETPILLLNRPGVLDSGFGVSLATATRGDRAQLLVGGAPLVSGAALYELGASDQPSLQATDTGFCRGDDTACFLSSSPAGLGVAAIPSGPHDLCFVVGSGHAPDGNGLVARCPDDDLEYHLEVPPDVATLVQFTINEAQGENFLFAADSRESPALLASVPFLGRAWFYAPLGLTPIELVPAEVPSGYGKTLAVASVGEQGRLFAVGAPDSGRVLLFKSEDGKSVTRLGCLGETAGFGRGLGAGAVLPGDPDDELVISDAANVYVFDGRALFDMPEAADASCSLGSLPAGTLITSFTCGSTKNVADCASARFGATLAVGDIDGDGDGEVVVGAPGMTVRGEKRAGAILIYDVERPGDADFAEIKFISSAEQDDELGSALVLPRLADRHVIAAGAPGNGKVALFYCSALLASDKRPSRCE